MSPKGVLKRPPSRRADRRSGLAPLCDRRGGTSPTGQDSCRRTGHVNCRCAPRSPRAGAPVTYVTTGTFLERFGLASLRDLPEMEKLEDEGLPSKDALLSGELATAFGIEIDEPGEDDEAEDDSAAAFAEQRSNGEED